MQPGCAPIPVNLQMLFSALAETLQESSGDRLACLAADSGKPWICWEGAGQAHRKCLYCITVSATPRQSYARTRALPLQHKKQEPVPVRLPDSGVIQVPTPRRHARVKLRQASSIEELRDTKVTSNIATSLLVEES